MTIYQIITDEIIRQLEKGVVPWRQPWNTQIPKNLRSLKEYHGINVFLLASKGYPSPYWLTYHQAKALGGSIKAGEHSTPVVYWQPRADKNRKSEEKEEKKFQIVLRYYRVFNLCQTEGIAEKLGLDTSESSRIPSIETCEKIVQDMPSPPQFEQSSNAWYRSSTDTLGIPPRDSFHSSEEYYSTLFHELAHSTGHPKRLNRPGIANIAMFASESYSKEELIAEMASAFLCGVSGISPATLTNSASYIRGWIDRLRSDTRLLVFAASQAQRAADYVLGRNLKIESEE